MLIDFIESLEKVIDFTHTKNMLPMQSGDINQIFANTSSLKWDYNYNPQINIKDGIQTFISWYKSFYKNTF